MLLARYFAVTAAALALGACGETVIDSGEIETQIAGDIEQETGTRDVEVDCPDDIEAKKGDTFECEATAPGGIKQTVEATQVDDDGGVDWKLVRP